jgi:hypothetical protein
MPSPEMRGFPGTPPPNPEQAPKFSFLKNKGEIADTQLQEFRRGTDRQENMRQLNILAGTERVLPNQKDAERINKESRRAEQLLHDVARAIHSEIHRKEQADNYTVPMAKLNNRLVGLMIDFSESEIQDQVSRIVRRLQRIFSEQFPHDVGNFLKWSRGREKGVIAATRFISERSREQLPENQSRKLFYNNDLDAKYGIDLIELNYQDKDGDMVIDDMRLIQVKSSAQRESNSEKIERDHNKFLEDFMANLSEYEAQYQPSIEFRNDDEQIAFNESLVELQNKIEIAGYNFVTGKATKNQFVSEIIAVLRTSQNNRRSEDLASLDKLPLQDKMWFVENYINNLMQFILDPLVEQDLKNVAQLIHNEMQKTDYHPPRAAVVNRISSSTWAPGDPMPGTAKNPGNQLYPSPLPNSSTNKGKIDKPVIIRN